MAILERHFVFVVCCFHLVTCNVQYATPLPTQCDNSVLELFPIHYIADGTNYSNCTLKGQPGTIIHGAIEPDCQSPQILYSGVTALAGTLVLDGVSLKAGILHIKGDEIILRNTTISTCYPGPHALAVKGGRVSFEDVKVRTSTSGGSGILLINTTMTLSNSSMGWGNFDVSNSSVSMWNSRVDVEDDQSIELTASIVNLTNSTFSLGHGHFKLLDSNATLTKSSIGVSMGTQGMSIGRSTVVADCDSQDGPWFQPTFYIGTGNSGPGVSIFSSRVTFHNCSCDISHAFHISAGQSSSSIEIDESSMHFEGCTASPTKEVYGVLV